MQRFESFSNSAEQHNCLLATLQIHGVTVKSILNSYKSWNEYTPPLHSMGIFQLWNIFSHVTAIVQLISEIKTILKIVKIHYEVKQLKSDGFKRSLAPYNSLSRQNIAQVNVRFTLDRLGGPENGHVCFGEITNGASWRRNLYVNYSKFRAMCPQTSMCMASKNFCIYYQDLYRDRKIPSHHEIFSFQ